MAVSPFPPPQHGWTCFHCGETFRSVAEAATHFGVSVDATPGCMIKVSKDDEQAILSRLREIEQERNELEVRLMASRLGLDKEGEDDAVERYRATRTVCPELFATSA